MTICKLRLRYAFDVANQGGADLREGRKAVGRDSRFERLVRGVEGVSTSREAFAKTCK